MKEILVEYEGQKIKVALFEGGQLVELYEEDGSTAHLTGNIYRGRVENILPGMQAAFVDVGLEKNAFLYVGDAMPQTYDEEEHSPQRNPLRVDQILKPRQELLVQILKEPLGNKGARVTTNLTIPGRYAVILPTVDYVGISRKIMDLDERNRLREIAENARPEGLGVIVRTLAQGVKTEDLVEDIEEQVILWESIKKKIPHTSIPGLVHQDVKLMDRLLREVIDEDVEAIITDNGDMAEMLRSELKSMGHKAAINVQFDYKQNLFVRYGVEDQIRKALKPRVWLRNGGYLVIQQTEALTVIDVNTGKYVGKTSLEETVLKTNLEAVKEITRQLRLRNIGGIIVIDFIDMLKEENQQAVLKALEEGCQKDRIKCQVFGLTQLGLVEMTRKKVGQPLNIRYTSSCDKCDGTGRII